MQQTTVHGSLGRMGRAKGMARLGRMAHLALARPCGPGSKWGAHDDQESHSYPGPVFTSVGKTRGQGIIRVAVVTVFVVALLQC